MLDVKADLPKMSEYEDDYARSTASAVAKLIERFCPPLGHGPVSV